MVKLIFGILTIIILFVGAVLIFGGSIFYPAKKYGNNEKLMMHKRTKLKLIGYVVCLVAFLIGLIIGSV